MENKLSTNESLIEKYGCKIFYLKIVECVKFEEKRDNLKFDCCKEEFRSLGECIINGQKIEEKIYQIKNL